MLHIKYYCTIAMSIGPIPSIPLPSCVCSPSRLLLLQPSSTPIPTFFFPFMNDMHFQLCWSLFIYYILHILSYVFMREGQEFGIPLFFSTCFGFSHMQRRGIIVQATWYIYAIKKDISTITLTTTCSKNKIVKLKYKY